MSSPPRLLPEFFKVYLPEYSSERLRIPTAFIGHFNGLVPEKAILRDFFGRVWHVEVGQIGKDVCFLNGWQRFLTDNSVEEGDFLVFRYDGNHIFDFKLFGRTACEKKDTDKVSVDIYQKDFSVKEEKDVEEAEREEEKQEEEEDEEEEEEEEEEDEEEEEEEEEEDEEEEEEEEEDEEEEEEEEEESSDEEEEDKTNDREEEEPQPKSSNKKVVVLKHKYSGRGRPPIGTRNYRGYKRTAVKKTRVAYIGTSHSNSTYKKPSCTQAEVDNSFAMASIVESKNPYFTTKLRPMRPSKLYVPVDVLKDHNIALPPRVLLRDPLGRSWPGDVAVWKDGRTWISGWRAFCKWNHVDENDTCICELVQERGHQGDVIVVHIQRAQPRLKAPNCS